MLGLPACAAVLQHRGGASRPEVLQPAEPFPGGVPGQAGPFGPAYGLGLLQDTQRERHHSRFSEHFDAPSRQRRDGIRGRVSQQFQPRGGREVRVGTGADTGSVSGRRRQRANGVGGEDKVSFGRTRTRTRPGSMRSAL